MTPAEVIERLEQAGATLIALRVARIGPSEPRSGLPEPVREASASYGWSKATTRPATPAAADIDRMDEALAFLNSQETNTPDQQHEAWKNLCHVVFNLKEFLFIE